MQQIFELFLVFFSPCFGYYLRMGMLYPFPSTKKFKTLPGPKKTLLQTNEIIADRHTHKCTYATLVYYKNINQIIKFNYSKLSGIIPLAVKYLLERNATL